MKTYVLVHGSWHGAWCWFKVVPRLVHAGHRALAIDLPGHGRAWMPPAEVTLQDYVDAVCGVLGGLDDAAILVGHSRGGIVISQAAERCPDKVTRLVYLAAFLIPSGEAMLATALSDTDSLIPPNLVVDEDDGWHMLKDEAQREALYHDCSDEDVALARSLLTPEPNAPVATPLELTESFARIPRLYIQCLQDRTVSPALQRRMYEATPCERVVSLETSHSPFLSAPDELVTQLVAA